MINYIPTNNHPLSKTHNTEMEKFSRLPLLSAVALLQGMFGSKLPSKENYSSRQGRVGFWTGPAVQSTRYSPETNSRVRGRDNKYVLESTFGEQWPVVSTAINSRLQWEQKWKWESSCYASLGLLHVASLEAPFVLKCLFYLFWCIKPILSYWDRRPL